MARSDGTPHRVVDNIANGVAEGAKRFVAGVTSSFTGVGGEIQRGLDAPFNALGGPQQPLRIVDRVLNGGLDAVNAGARGGIGVIQTAAEGVQSGLDHPVENFGVPPGLLGRSGMSGLKLPFPPGK